MIVTEPALLDVYNEVKHAFYHLERARILLHYRERTSEDRLCCEVRAAAKVVEMVQASAGLMVQIDADSRGE